MKQLAAKVGEVQEVELRAVPSRTGGFHRVRVKLMEAKPLTMVVTLASEGQSKSLLQVKDEKLSLCTYGPCPLGVRHRGVCGEGSLVQSLDDHRGGLLASR